ncbi:HIT domain-containing protein [Alteromonas ponticola]|uniref:HIT domain-containing protein n=1 Tax=Alteromonas ponticola TaxID=2720613 RepID=A0ABX1QX27_9ALTE|nr:HIT domain-containing protein [Alteromonas ponticola]NMH58784.1 HIT domain-containing protein [Alteromonas ponticola]
MFRLDTRLEQDTLVVGDLPLCRVLLMNDKQFPWVILVPRLANAVEICQLHAKDRVQLWEESHQVSEAMLALFSPDKLNVAALGNVVKQLHLHHVARFVNDCAWPQPIWGRQPAVPYSSEQASVQLTQLRKKLSMEE